MYKHKPSFLLWMSLGVLAAMSAGCSSNHTESPDSGGSSGGTTGTSGSGGTTGMTGSGGTTGTTGSGGTTGTSGSGGSTTSNGSGGAAGSSSGSGGSGSGGADGGAKQDASTVATYPTGPYCTAVGQNGHLPDSPGCVLPPTIPPGNAPWMGYVDDNANQLATMEPYVAYSFADAFKYAQQNNKKYLMVNVAEFTCPGCGESAAIMSQTGDAGVTQAAAVVQAGGMVIEVLESANFVAVPTQMQLQTWISDPTAAQGAHALYVTTVADAPSSSGTPSWSFFGRRDQAYIVDLTTMKIIKYIDGNIGPTAGGTGNSGPQAMAYMHMLLGK